MLWRELGKGVCSGAFRSIGFPKEEVEAIDHEAGELLDEALLSPTHSSEPNSPLRNTSAPQPHLGYEVSAAAATTKSSQPTNIASNPWETIETTVVYDNGSKETILAPTIPPVEVIANDESCSEKCWDCIEHVFLKLVCSRSSLQTAEMYKNMSKVFFKVDRIAGRVFPLTFLIINITYWTLYMYIL